MIQLVLNKQNLSRVDNNDVYSKTSNYLQCQFTFDSDWYKYTKYVSFNNIEVTIPDTNIVNIPNDAIDNHNTIEITVYGKYDDSIITTGKIIVDILESGYSGSETPVSDYKQLYEETLLQLEVANNKVNEITEQLNETTEQLNILQSELDETTYWKNYYKDSSIINKTCLDDTQYIESEVTI